MWDMYASKHLLVYFLDGVFHYDLARVEMFLCFVRNIKYQMKLQKLQYLSTGHHHLGHCNEVTLDFCFETVELR